MPLVNDWRHHPDLVAMPQAAFLGTLRKEYEVLIETGGRLSPGMHEFQLGARIHHLEIPDGDMVPPGNAAACCKALGIPVEEFYAAVVRRAPASAGAASSEPDPDPS